MTASIPSEKYRIPRPITTAVKNLGQEIPKVPADKTKILNGVGGGNNDGTITARTPCRWYHRCTLFSRSSAKVFRRNFSPPLRPTAYRSEQPMTEPTIVKQANFTIWSGSLIANVISKRSFTSGNDTKDESHIASTMSPNPPYGSRVCLSQIDIASKFINCIWGSQRSKSRGD